jgi:NAD(P)-dependent dehydrogenase (short-subunit alcohol dehydrogenase family)
MVVVVGRNGDKLRTVVGERRDGGVADGAVCTSARRRRSGARCKASSSGRIDALVNNAGGQYIAPLEGISAKGWDAVIATNLTGGFLMARECHAQSMKARGGTIVNIVADMWGSMPNMAHSGAARAGMVSFTETAAAEWAAHGVRVNAVAPGYIASSGMDHYPPEAARCCARCAAGAARALRHRGGSVGGDRVPAEPGGRLRERHGAARGRRSPAGAHGLADDGARPRGPGASGGEGLRGLPSRDDTEGAVGTRPRPAAMGHGPTLVALGPRTACARRLRDALSSRRGTRRAHRAARQGAMLARIDTLRALEQRAVDASAGPGRCSTSAVSCSRATASRCSSIRRALVAAGHAGRLAAGRRIPSARCPAAASSPASASWPACAA